MHKICPSCKEIKSLDLFSLFKSGRRIGKYSYNCLNCLARKARVHRESHKEHYREQQLRFQNSAKGIYKILKRKIKHYGKKSFDLDQSTFVEWYESSPKQCHYCSVPESVWVTLNNPMARRYKRMSIDRTNSSVGYTHSNIVLSCFRCNIIKSDILSESEMKEIGQKYLRPKWESGL